MKIKMKPSDLFRYFLIDYLNKNAALTQVNLAKKAEVQYKQLNSYLNGKQTLGEEARARIAEALERRYEECLEIGRFIVQHEKSEKGPSTFHKHTFAGIHGREETNLLQCKALPLYESDHMSAHPASIINVAVSDVYERMGHRLKALRVQDDSMWPGIPQGAIVIVDLDDQKFREKKIFLVNHFASERFVIRVCRKDKLYKEDFENIVLVSQNPEYLPEITTFDWKELVVGKVIFLLRDLENL